jgi:hypothetical protein
MTRKLSLPVLLVALGICCPGHAQTEPDRMPERRYLMIHTDYGGIDSKGTCHIENTSDRSKMTCGEWLARYCPTPSVSPACRTFEEEIGQALERD